MTSSYYSYGNQNMIIALKRELLERKSHYGINHFSVAETLSALALTYYHMMNDHETAIKIHYEAKQILEEQQERHSQQNLVNLAITIGDIGNCFWKKGDYQSARNEHMKSLQFFESCQINENHPKAKLCMHTMKDRLGLLQTNSMVHRHQSNDANDDKCNDMPKQGTSSSSSSSQLSAPSQSRIILSLSTTKIAPFIENYDAANTHNNHHQLPHLTLNRPQAKNNTSKITVSKKKSFEKTNSFTTLLPKRRHRSYTTLCKKRLSKSFSNVETQMAIQW